MRRKGVRILFGGWLLSYASCLAQSDFGSSGDGQPGSGGTIVPIQLGCLDPQGCGDTSVRDASPDRGPALWSESGVSSIYDMRPPPNPRLDVGLPRPDVTQPARDARVPRPDVRWTWSDGGPSPSRDSRPALPPDIGPPPPDSGVASPDPDAGTPTTCRVSLSPSVGGRNTPFDLRFESNGSACKWRLDSGNLDLRSCNFTTTWRVGTSPGLHTVTLVVLDGPGGATECSTSFRYVEEEEEETDCQIDITPSSGDKDAIFTWTIASDNGSECYWSIDGSREWKLSKCNDTLLLRPEHNLGSGHHTITLIVTQGPTGRAECSTSYYRAP